MLKQKAHIRYLEPTRIQNPRSLFYGMTIKELLKTFVGASAFVVVFLAVLYIGFTIFPYGIVD